MNTLSSTAQDFTFATSFDDEVANGGDLIGTMDVSDANASRRIVIAEFPDIEHAKQFFHSESDGEARKLRLNAAEMVLFAVEGFEEK